MTDTLTDPTTTERREIATRYISSLGWNECFLEGSDVRDDQEMLPVMAIVGHPGCWETEAFTSVDDARWWMTYRAPAVETIVVIDLDEGAVYERGLVRTDRD